MVAEFHGSQFGAYPMMPAQVNFREDASRLPFMPFRQRR